MLSSLSIQNFALIDKLNLNFENGFTVFTGETGSGKSIILGALNLILGERADNSVIRDNEQKTIVEAHFNVKEYNLSDFFSAKDLDYQDETIIRREVLSQGKSRAFINDSPVQLSVLKEFAEKLIHIHSQHHTLSLKEQTFQFDFIDYISGAISIREEFKKEFHLWKKLSQKLLILKNKLIQNKKEEDYNLFQLNEIENLNLDKVNYSNLEEELIELENFSTIKETLATIDFKLNSDQQVLDIIYEIKALLEKNKHLFHSFKTMSEQLISIVSELKEIQSEVNNNIDSLTENPIKKHELEERISTFNQVLLKHNIKNQEDLLLYYHELKSKQNDNENLLLEINNLENEVLIKAEKIKQLDDELQKTRLNHTTAIENKVKSLLSELKMSATKFQFLFEKVDQLNDYGSNKLSILFSPNIGIEAKSIEKVASGGELSRLMLSLQLMLSEKKMLPTIIFDEIDTGVSGDVAQKLGELLQKMGAKMQVMTITHLPQVAAKGNHHFKVLKSLVNQQTNTNVNLLSSEEHIEEVARLMSGENINEAAIENAKILINS